MTPKKSQTSSRRKGKEAVDDLATREVGKEAAYSESDHSNEEEEKRDPNSECAPFINPWHNVHSHFPKVSGDYVPLLSCRVWLALCLCNIDVSWAPLASSIFDIAIRQGTSLPIPIHFEFGSGVALCWQEWVDRELSDKGFMGLL